MRLEYRLERENLTCGETMVDLWLNNGITGKEKAP